MSRSPALRNVVGWLDPRTRGTSSWAFIVNRVTALGLSFYLVLHLVVLSKLVQGPAAYNDFVAYAETPWIKGSEILLVAAVLFHGLNGLRLTLHGSGIGVRSQKLTLAGVAVLTLAVTVFFAVHLFVR